MIEDKTFMIMTTINKKDRQKEKFLNRYTIC